MKSIMLKIGMSCVALFMTLNVAIAATPLSHFNGTFKNTDANTRGLTKIKITVSGSKVKIHAFGSCSPKDCDWGAVSAVAYGKSVSSNVKTDTKVIIGRYKTSFSRTEVMIFPRAKGVITVRTFTRFTDNSGRTPYASSYTMKKSAGGGVALGTPVLISPKSNAVFNHYPRKTTLKWKPVRGAKKYILEVDCFHCCKSGKWCGDVGKMFKTETVTGTSHTFNWVGANKGRWRVRAVGANGKKGRASKWRVFTYTR